MTGRGATEIPLPHAEAVGTTAGARRKAIAFAVIVVGVVADLLTKRWMQDLLAMHPSHPQSTKRISLVPGFLALEGTWNTGITFGFAQGQTQWILLFTVVAIVLLNVWLVATRQPSTALHLGLGFVIGGALGNLYDRWNWQKVRDFVLFYLGDLENPSFKWPNFNLADSMIVSGVVLILWEELFGRRRRLRRARSAVA